MKRIGLALGSGGARGLVHIHICRALDELERSPAIIAGTSFGAIVGAFYAGGMSGTEMEALARSLDLLDFGKMMDFAVLRPSGLIRGKRVEEFLDKHLPKKTFESLEIPLKVVATDFWNRRAVVFDSGDLIPAIRASISVPGIFEPVNVDDTVMIDGFPVSPVPMEAIRDACDVLIAVDVSGTSEPPKRNRSPNMFESVMATFHIMESSFVRNQLKIYRPEIYVKPNLVNVQILDFHRTDEILDSTRDDVNDFKDRVEALFADKNSD